MKPRHLYLMAMILAVIAETALAQPPQRPGPPGIEMIIQGYDRAERELKLSDDVTGKLLQLREELQTAFAKECRSAGINPLSPTLEQRDTWAQIRRRLSGEFNPKAAALLSPDQLHRVQQIDFQFRLKARAPDALLAEEVAAELKLTDEQGRALNTLKSENAAKQTKREFNRAEYMGKALAVLTNDQKEALNKLQGKEVPSRPTDDELLARYERVVPTFLFIQNSPSVIMVHCAALEAVQYDLKVSDEVARKLTLLRDNYRATYKKACQDAEVLQTPAGFSTLSPEYRKLQEIGRKLDEEFIPKVNELLSPAQQKRYQQILFQNRFAYRGPDALLDAAAELKLTDDQQQKLKALRIDRNVERTLKPSKAAELLTEEQKATLDTLKGAEFDVKELVIRGRTRDT